MLFIAGCAGGAVRVDFPLNHPVNPQAPESSFRPPQNPFQTDVAAMEEESTKDSTMKHKTPKESGKQQQHMGPKNTLPMMMGKGPFGDIEMGEMFTVIKVRDHLKSYDEDPGWYKHPEGTIAYRLDEA